MHNLDPEVGKLTNENKSKDSVGKVKRTLNTNSNKKKFAEDE